MNRGFEMSLGHQRPWNSVLCDPLEVKPCVVSSPWVCVCDAETPAGRAALRKAAAESPQSLPPVFLTNRMSRRAWSDPSFRLSSPVSWVDA